jgi:hypothetical protein
MVHDGTWRFMLPGANIVIVEKVEKARKGRAA